MQELGVISPVQEPTDWCSGMVVVPKTNGKVRICVDLTKLNENVRQELHQLPSVEQVLAQIAGAKVFSKLDCNSGFWQIPLNKDSASLTTFTMPFGQYHFNRVTDFCENRHFSLFRVSPDSRILLSTARSLSSCSCCVLLYTKTSSIKHTYPSNPPSNADIFFWKCSGADVIPNGSQVCRTNPFGVWSGIRPREGCSDSLNGVSDVRRFLGMANQLSKFIPHLADMSKPLRDLLAKNNLWC